MKNAVIAGTFDPVTVGHKDLIMRAAALFDHVTVGIFENGEKHTMFGADVRTEAMRAALDGIENVSVEKATDTTLSDFAKAHDAVIVKGIRNATDADYEIQLSAINKEIGGTETVILACSPEYSFISSTFVREMIKYGKPYKKYVPRGAYEIIKKAAK